VVIPPAGYLKRARELCTANNIVLILDEIRPGSNVLAACSPRSTRRSRPT
jgi:glutamate-1-semialdehyde aminotransferase